MKKLRNRELKNIMIKKYCLERLRFDFMGYYIQSYIDITYHHLLIPRCESKEEGFGSGYYYWNGVLLNSISHEYLHVIERFDDDRFFAITSELLDEMVKGYISLENIRKINDILDSFEREYFGKQWNKKDIIQSEYYNRLFKDNSLIR